LLHLDAQHHAGAGAGQGRAQAVPGDRDLPLLLRRELPRGLGLNAGAALPIGVVGVGSLGFHHARILSELPGAKLVGVHDTDRDRGMKVAEELGTTYHTELDGLLSKVEAAVVAVPTSHHTEVSLAAL